MISVRGCPPIAPGLNDPDSISNSTLLQSAPATIKKYRLLEVKLIRLEQRGESPGKSIIERVTKSVGHNLFINDFLDRNFLQIGATKFANYLGKALRPGRVLGEAVGRLSEIDSNRGGVPTSAAKPISQ